MTLYGVVLAGGASRRMGTDKAVLRIDGQRLVDRAVACLTELCDEVVVASGSRVIPDLAVSQVADAITDAGPVAGLAAGLAALPQRGIAFVIAVDMPDPDGQLLQALGHRWAGESALVPSADGRPQPFHAVWQPEAAPALVRYLEGGGRSAIDAVTRLSGTILDEATSRGLAAHDGWSANLNDRAAFNRRRAR